MAFLAPSPQVTLPSRPFHEPVSLETPVWGFKMAPSPRSPQQPWVGQEQLGESTTKM
jgi:hypothetical protein